MFPFAKTRTLVHERCEQNIWHISRHKADVTVTILQEVVFKGKLRIKQNITNKRKIDNKSSIIQTDMIYFFRIISNKFQGYQNISQLCTVPHNMCIYDTIVVPLWNVIIWFMTYEAYDILEKKIHKTEEIKRNYEVF